MIKLSFCSTCYNRFKQIALTLPTNISNLQQDEQIVLVDYDSKDGLEDYILNNHKKDIDDGRLKYIRIYDQSYYNCPIAKNIAHYYADGEYVVNLDCDNFIVGMRDILDQQLSKQQDKFILHLAVLDGELSRTHQKQHNDFIGSFGRILLKKSDFVEIGGYNELFLPIAYQDSDLILRCIANGYSYCNVPLNNTCIDHSKYILYGSDTRSFSWNDCNLLNQQISDNNIANNHLKGFNVPKEIKAKVNFNEDIVIDYSNTEQTSSHNIKYGVCLSGDDDVYQQFISYKFKSHEQLLDFYLQFIANDLMFQEPEIINAIRNKLKKSINQYASQHSTFYKDHSKDNIYTRNNLCGSNWICSSILKERILNLKTSGSTTGQSFYYYGDTKYFEKVQLLSEFDLIKKEFGLQDKKLKILNLLKHPHNPEIGDFAVEFHNHAPGNKFSSYGATEFDTWFINFEEYMSEPKAWHEKLIEFLSGHEFDIMLSSGSIINVLTKYIRESNFTHTFANLLSHTTEFAIIDDFQFLKENGNIKCYCDHMRCWDGGAGFFTCKHGTYHLNDNFAWISEGPDNKLISTDYFNVVAPFINYWSGDLCQIVDEYHLCDCGRYYRPFKIIQSRPFALKGPSRLINIQKQVADLSFKNKISQVQFDKLCVNIYCNETLTENEISILDTIFIGYSTKYI